VSPVGREVDRESGPKDGPLAVLAWALVYLAVAGALQAYTVAPLDADTAYHVAVGRLIREHGLLRAFPWTPFSILADHYADKELLLHLAFAAMAGIPWITAAKLAGTVIGAGTLFAIYAVLRQERVRLAGLWALLPLAASGAFVYRFALVRPHVASIGLAVLALWLAARRRLVGLAVLAAVYPWVHLSWHLPLLLAVLAEGSRLLVRDRPRPGTVLAAAGGIAVGIALHPNGLELVRLNWIHMVEVLGQNVWAERAGFQMGNEFRPFTLVQAARYLLLPAAMCVAAALLAWRGRARRFVPVTFAAAALVLGVLTLRSARFIELFTPFSTVALALALASTGWRIPAAVFSAALVYTATVGSPAIRNVAGGVDLVPPPLAAWLQQRIPVGAQVFTCEWDTTGPLMLALPERRFVVALDPTLFYAKDPQLYEIWYRLPREAPLDSALVVREDFGARYVLCSGSKWRRFLARLGAAPGVKLLGSNPAWTLLEIAGEGAEAQ
jgi:hypothetical protein